jgi:hypothetical protein
MANIIGPNAGGTVNKSEVDSFISFLSNPNTQIPVDSNFVVMFKDIPAALTNNSLNVWKEFENVWDVQGNMQALTQEIISPNKSTGGYVCFFANGVNIPGESVRYERSETFPTGGLIGGVAGGGRSKYGDLTISFLETNKSFIDFVIRPWITLVGHYGLITRKSTSVQNIKTNISVFHFDKNDMTTNGGVRRVFEFNGCAPVSINETTYAYGKSEMRTEGVRFVFNTYKLSYGPNSTPTQSAPPAVTTKATPAAITPVKIPPIVVPKLEAFTPGGGKFGGGGAGGSW